MVIKTSFIGDDFLAKYAYVYRELDEIENGSSIRYLGLVSSEVLMRLPQIGETMTVFDSIADKKVTLWVITVDHDIINKTTNICLSHKQP